MTVKAAKQALERPEAHHSTRIYDGATAVDKVTVASASQLENATQQETTYRP